MLNSQFVWVTESRPNRPIRYEMHGYDSMLGSYYDHYVLEYISFEGWLTTMARFDLPKGKQIEIRLSQTKDRYVEKRFENPKTLSDFWWEMP